MARDLFAAWQRSPSNAKCHQQYISTTRAQALLAAQLGESVATMARLKVVGAGGNGNGLAAQLARHRLTAQEDDDS
jgi:hypothetical protein